jgi:endonuclease G
MPDKLPPPEFNALLNGQPPTLVNEKLADKTRELCYAGFAVLHSGVTRTPLWSAEHLTQDRITAARGLTRQGEFHPDPNVPEAERAELSDYARSGFDRGHMSPSGDMPTIESQELLACQHRPAESEQQSAPVGQHRVGGA